MRQDTRHPKTGKVHSSRILITVISYSLSSLVLAASLSESHAPAGALLFAALNYGLMMVAFTVASGYYVLMGYPRENEHTRVFPASQKSQYVARLISIATFFSLIILSISLPIGFVFYGQMPDLQLLNLMFWLMAGMVWVLLITLTLLWLIILIAPYNWLKRSTLIFQAGVVLVLVMGHQWVSNNQVSLPDVPWWPAIWFVDLFEGNFTLGTIILAVNLIFLVPLLGKWFPDRYFLMLRKVIAGEHARQKKTSKKRSASLIEKLLVRKQDTLAIYHFAKLAFTQDAMIQRRVWPSLLIPVTFAIFGWWTDALGDMYLYLTIEDIPGDVFRMQITLLLILFFTAQSLVQTVQYTKTPEASWLFDVMPIMSVRRLQMATQQAISYQLLMPLFGILFVLLITKIPIIHAILHLGVWWTGCMFLMRMQLLFYRKPPFTQRADRFAMAGRFLPLVVATPMAVIFLVLSPWLYKSELATVIFIAGGAVVNAGILLTPGLFVRVKGLFAA